MSGKMSPQLITHKKCLGKIMPLYIADIQKSACSIITEQNREKGEELAEKFLKRFGEDDAYSFSKTNQIESMIGHYLLDSIENPRWKEAHRKTKVRLDAYLEELDRVAALLAQHNIPLVALKNGGIARGIYPCSGCCPMGDIDVLVRRSDFREAHNLLVGRGYNFEFRSHLEVAELDDAEMSGGAEYWTMLPGGEKLWFELQWRPVAGRWLRPDQEPTAEELMARSIPIPGTAVRLLSPEDNLLQVSLHTAKHTYLRAPGFRLHLDVERIVRNQQIDWDLFLSRVQELQVKTAVYFSLYLPTQFFDTPIPQEILKALRPRKWKERLVISWLKRAGFFNPEEKKFGRIGYIVFNMLLYDDIGGVLRGIIPDRKWMIQHYEIKNDFLVPIYHLKRLFDLAFRRMKT